MAEWITANVSVLSIIHQSELLYYISLANEGLRTFIVSNTFIIRSFELYVCLLNRCFYSLTLRRDEDSRVHKRARVSRKEAEGWRKRGKRHNRWRHLWGATRKDEKHVNHEVEGGVSSRFLPFFSDETLCLSKHITLILKTCNYKIVWYFYAQSLNYISVAGW